MERSNCSSRERPRAASRLKCSTSSRTAVALAVSPAAFPPIPSQTTKSPASRSYPKLSSLFVRLHPISVNAATSTFRAVSFSMVETCFLRTDRLTGKALRTSGLPGVKQAVPQLLFPQLLVAKSHFSEENAALDNSRWGASIVDRSRLPEPAPACKVGQPANSAFRI